MSQEFDPYLLWLGISKHEPRPVNLYRLLGVDRLESDTDVIAINADKQIEHVRKFSRGPQGELAEQLITELTKAKLTLLKPERRAAYNQTLQQPPPLPAAEPLKLEPVKPEPPRAAPPEPAAREQTPPEPAPPVQPEPEFFAPVAASSASAPPLTIAPASPLPLDPALVLPPPLVPPLPRVTPPLVTPPQVVFRPAAPPPGPSYPLAYVPPPAGAASNGPVRNGSPLHGPSSKAPARPKRRPRGLAQDVAPPNAPPTRLQKFWASLVDLRESRVYLGLVFCGFIVIVIAGLLVGEILGRWGFETEPEDVSEDRKSLLDTPLTMPTKPRATPVTPETPPPAAAENPMNSATPMNSAAPEPPAVMVDSTVPE